MLLFRSIAQRFFNWPWCATLLLASACRLPAAEAPEYMVKTWGVDDGLPESGITDVIQSPDGYLWVSTLNSGLSRFDGVRFVNFDLPFGSKFASRGVRRLFADEEGTIWINGFGNYLASLRKGVFRLEQTEPVVINWLVWQKAGRVVFATKEGQLLEGTQGDGAKYFWKIISPPVTGQTRFFADRQTGFWYRRADGQLCQLVGGKAELISPGSGSARIAALAGDNQGRIAAANTEGLFVRADGKFQNLTPTNGEPNLAVKGLVSDGQGGWWVEANNRLRRCQGKQWIAEAVEWRDQKRSWSKAKWEQADSSGGLWLAYTDGGLLHVGASGKLSALTTSDGLPSNRVRTLSQDREENLWASFERGGLARVRRRVFQSVGNREGLAGSVTTSVCEDGQGAIWVGTLSGAVSCWNHVVCSNFTLPQEGTHCEMSTVFPDSHGRIWIGTHGNGLLAYEAGQFRHVLSIGQIGVNIRGIFVSRDDRVWIASQDGLFCFANRQVQRVLTPKSEEDYPAALAEGADGTIWVAMNAGVLVKLTGSQVESFQPPDTSMRSRFSAVCQDVQGNVWIGTLGAGLLRFREGRFTAITKRDGLPTDSISQVLDDATGRLWLGSPAGVISVQKELADNPDGNLVCRVYGCDDGLPTVGCATASQPTAWRGRNGRLWFATANGATSVQPSDSETKKRPPLVVLEDLLVDGQPGSSPTGKRILEAIAPIKLSPGRHHLEFRYTGLSFAAPERIRFKYMLEGLDEGWVENRTERNASYNSVPVGEYRFRVMACNSDGVWSETEASLAMSLPPHLWETRWFRLVAFSATLVAVAGSVFWVLHLRHRRQLKALAQQHALERERARIAQDLHDDLGTTLTQIDLLGALASRPGMPLAETLEQVGLIQTKSREMVTALDEIVWAVNPRNDSLRALTTYLCNFAEDFLSKTSIRCRLDVADEVPESALKSEVRHSLFLAFKEALNNVVRHSRASEVWLGFKVEGRLATLTVQDNGQGFDANSGPSSSGNGLHNMQARMSQIGGHCALHTKPETGTAIEFTFPLP